MNEEKRFAVLVDAENVSPKYVKYIMDEISGYGDVTYKRIYTDWTQQLSQGWKNVLMEFAFSPIQQYSYSQGKNSTDSAMIIDAMDILYSGKVEGFCIVSSDSDFTKLAIRLKESGMMVIGMGEQKTPKAFSAACNAFKYLDILAEDDEENKRSKNKEEKNGKESAAKDPEKTLTPLETINSAILKILSDREDDGRLLSIGELGNLLIKRYTDFDVRNYGYSKLSKFLESQSFIKLSTKGTIIYASLADITAADDLEREIIALIELSGGQMDLSRLAQKIMDIHPTFNVRDYGYTKFQNMIQGLDGVNVRPAKGRPTQKDVYLEKAGV